MTEEYLIPNKYKGDGYGISVMFAGLNQDKYELLEISIDGVNYTAINRDAENLYNSKPLEFAGLESGLLYKVYGRLSADGKTENIECNMLPQDGSEDDAFDIDAIRKSGIPVGAINIQMPVVEG